MRSFYEVNYLNDQYSIYNNWAHTIAITQETFDMLQNLSIEELDVATKGMRACLLELKSEEPSSDQWEWIDGSWGHKEKQWFTVDNENLQPFKIYEYEDPGCWRPTIRISGEGCEFFLHTYEDCELLASSLEAHLQVCELIKLDKLEYQKLQDIQANPTSKPAKARKL